MVDVVRENTRTTDSTSDENINANVVASAETGNVRNNQPFYIHPSYSPGMTLVNTIFDGKGYVDWTRGILIALSVKNKIVFIDGTIMRSTVSSNISRLGQGVMTW